MTFVSSTIRRRAAGMGDPSLGDTHRSFLMYCSAFLFLRERKCPALAYKNVFDSDIGPDQEGPRVRRTNERECQTGVRRC